MTNHIDPRYSPLPIEEAPQELMQSIFNEAGYVASVRSGQLKSTVLKERHLKSPNLGQGPRCTVGQYVLYYQDTLENWVAEVYQYLRPDNTLGASGLPDPKRLRLLDKILIAQ
jgi:hypothetical protein